MKNKKGFSISRVFPAIAHNVLQISEGKDLETKFLTLKQNIIMKTKTSNYRRYFAFAYVLLAVGFITNY